MAKADYKVVLILPGRSNDYFDFWTRGIEENNKGEKLHPALLARTILISARSKSNAEEQARKMHPDHMVDSKATLRLG